MCDASNPIFSIFYTVFGALLKACCAISGNYYIVALFIFSLIVQVALFPLSIKQQKSSVKMGKLRPKELLIREKYKGRKDKATMQKMNMEVQELYSKEGYNPYAGCLPMLIQLPIIIILWGVIKMPLTYTTTKPPDVSLNSQYQVAVQILDGAVGAIEESGLVVSPAPGENSGENEASAPEISVLPGDGVEGATKEKLSKFMEDYTAAMKGLGAAVEDNRWNGAPFDGNSNNEFLLTQFIVSDYRTKIMEDLMDAGISETLVREKIPEDIEFNKEFKESIPVFTYFGSATLLDTPSNKGLSSLIFIPLLVFITSFYGGVVTKKFSVQPATADGVQPGGNFMKWGLPLLSTYFAWASFPAAVGVYWIYRTIFGIGQSYILARMYPIPKITEEDLANLKKQLKTKKKKVITIEVDEDDDSYDNLIIKADRNKSPKSKYEMLSPDEDKGGKPKIERAPLKDDNAPPDGEPKEEDDDTDED